jgi:hypothetical protein
LDLDGVDALLTVVVGSEKGGMLNFGAEEGRQQSKIQVVLDLGGKIVERVVAAAREPS